MCTSTQKNKKIIDIFSSNELANVLQNIKANHVDKIIYPPESEIFNSLEMKISDVKVVILGQDPYHGEGQANGLAFAVNIGTKIPPSLRNIFKEIEAEFGAVEADCTLNSWTKQGVLLLNAVLTVNGNEADSHKSQGWEEVTTKILKELSKNEIVFIALGNNALKIYEQASVPTNKILFTSHPSPLSSYRGFSGSKIFSQANYALDKMNKKGIKW